MLMHVLYMLATVLQSLSYHWKLCPLVVDHCELNVCAKYNAHYYRVCHYLWPRTLCADTFSSENAMSSVLV